MIKKASLYALEKAIQQALKLDSAMADKLRPLNDKVIKIIIAPLNITFYQCIEEGKILLRAHSIRPADTTITSSPLGFIRLSLLPPSRARSLFNDTVKITGDVELGQQLKRLFDEMDIDWEGHLAHFTGDLIAHQVGQMARRGKSFGQRVKDSMQANLTEFLQEEARALPGREEIDDFMSDVDELRLRVDRLMAHIEKGYHEAN